MKTKWYDNFSDWPGPELIERWGLKLNTEAVAFRTWIEAPDHPPNQTSSDVLEACRKDLYTFHQGWNETELLAQFIGPVLRLVGYRGPSYNFFFERKLTAKLEGRKLTGTVDALVARGLSEPEEPYFFIHEYSSTSTSAAASPMPTPRANS